MEIEYIDPEKLKRDVNQPRTVFDEEDISRLAGTYQTFDGIIDPIEVDQDDIIVRGERRWRAAVLAKMDKVPVIRKEIKSVAKRLERQSIEGKHHSPIDRAWSYATEVININIPHMTDKELKKLGVERKEYNINDIKNIINKRKNLYVFDIINFGMSIGTGKKLGMSELSRRIGVQTMNIYNYINLIKLHPDIQELIKEKKIGITTGGELSKLPEELQIKLAKVIRDTGDLNYSEVVKWRTILQENPTEAENLFDKSCKMNKKGREEVLKAFSLLTDKGYTPSEKLIKIIVERIKERTKKGEGLDEYEIRTLLNFAKSKILPEEIIPIPDGDRRMLNNYTVAEEKTYLIVASHINDFKTKQTKNEGMNILWNIYNHSKKQLIELGQLADVDESKVIMIDMVN